MATKRVITAKNAELQGFARVIDVLEARRLVQRAIDGQVNVDVRFVHPEIRFTSKTDLNSNVKESLDIVIPDSVALQLLDADTTKLEAMIIAFLKGQTLLCIRSTACTWEKRKLIVPPPWDLFKHQRRKEPRFEIPSAYELSVTIDAIEGPSRRVSKKLMDISSSGLSFQVISRREAGLFRPGLFLKSMKVKIDGKEMTLDGQVRNVLPLKEDSRTTGMKVGAEFVRIKPQDEDYITAYVARNLAQFSF